MSIDPMSFQANLQVVRERIASAAQRGARDAAAVRIIAVTKGHPPELIPQVLQESLFALGENRVQEAVEKQRALKQLSVDYPRMRWHLLGHLQANKAKKAAHIFDVIHSLDSEALVEALSKHRTARVEVSSTAVSAMGVFIQVNVSGEPQKTGCRAEQAQRLAHSVLAAPSLELLGLMTMAPYTEDKSVQRVVFSKLRRLRDNLAIETGRPLALSMGMSQDFEIAIEEGADFVRLGTALFGARPLRP